MKRLLDILVAVLLLVAFGPLAMVVALLLWLMQRKVLFKQVRPGLRGCPFVLYKFCSMTEQRDAGGHLLSDAERLTWIGNIVRKTSIDELPQLWNVLRGDMSMVGPRPLLMEYLGRYSSHQARRHEVKPGITGWAQVNGRNAISWEQKLDFDVWYVDHAGLLLDLKIMGMTIKRVILGSGISSNGHASMPEFLRDDVDHVDIVLPQKAVGGGETER